MKMPRPLQYTPVIAAAMLIAIGPAIAGEGKRKTLEGPNSSATTQPDGTGFSGKREKRDDAVNWLRTTIDSLTPTDDQRTQVRTIVGDMHKAREKWKDDHETELKSLREEADAAQAAKDKERIKASQDKSKELWATSPKFTEALAKIRAILTPDQQTAFDAALQAKRDELKDDAAAFFEERPRPKPKSGDGAKGRNSGKQLNL